MCNIKFANAQVLTQPAVGTISTLNEGTDRIMEMIDKEIEKEKNLSKKSKEKKSDIKFEKEKTDVETFYPVTEMLKENKNETEKEILENKNDTAAKTKIIAAIGGGVEKVNTDNGGEIKNKIGGADIAYIRELKTTSGTLTVGGVIDYSHNNFESDSYIDGDGKIKAITAGIVAKQNRDDGVYYEGSVRMGHAKTNLNSASGFDYDESAKVYAGHIKAGKNIKMSEKNSVDIYGTYNFAHQDGINVKTSSNGKYELDTITGNKLKVGCRMSTKVRNGKIYYGIAYQHELSAKVKAKSEDNEPHFSKAKGGSGLLELGYKISADKNDSLNLNLNATGFAGRQKGVIFQLQLSKSF